MKTELPAFEFWSTDRKVFSTSQGASVSADDRTFLGWNLKHNNDKCF